MLLCHPLEQPRPCGSRGDATDRHIVCAKGHGALALNSSAAVFESLISIPKANDALKAKRPFQYPASDSLCTAGNGTSVPRQNFTFTAS